MRKADIGGGILGLLVVGTVMVGVTFLGHQYEKMNRRNRSAMLEPNAADAFYLGDRFINVNRDTVPGKECYFRDPVAGIEYVVTRDSSTRILTFTPLRIQR